MLATEKYLQEGGDLGPLGIKQVRSKDGLVILNYGRQTPQEMKTHPVVRECRGLVLTEEGWNVVARPFERFYNLGEVPELDEIFHWPSAICQEKCDGSLIVVYRWLGELRINTRGSFANGKINGKGKTWRELFLSTVDVDALNKLVSAGCTWMFELCSPHNKVVRFYPQPVSYLLGMNSTYTPHEYSSEALDWAAAKLRCLRPTQYPFKDNAAMKEFLEKHEDPTYEGFVVVDRGFRRIKIKSARYVRLHKLWSNGSMDSPRKAAELILSGEADEYLLHFPESRPLFEEASGKILEAEQDLLRTWEENKGAENRKAFAGAVHDHPLAGFLFAAYSSGKSPLTFMRSDPDTVLKRVFPKR